MASQITNLGIIIKPLQNAGFSLSDFIQAFLDNENRSSRFDLVELEKMFGSVLYETPLMTPYANLSYRILAKFSGSGKHTISFNVEFNQRVLSRLITESKFSSPSFHPINNFRFGLAQGLS